MIGHYQRLLRNCIKNILTLNCRVQFPKFQLNCFLTPLFFPSRRGTQTEQCRLGALPSRDLSFRDHRHRIPHVPRQHVLHGRLPDGQEQAADHIPQPALHGPTAGAGTDPAEEPGMQHQLTTTRLLKMDSCLLHDHCSLRSREGCQWTLTVWWLS